jgi:hypothetical protein
VYMDSTQDSTQPPRDVKIAGSSIVSSSSF